MALMKAPYKDFNGNDLFDGDYIEHPNGERGKVIVLANKENDADKWRVDYEDGGSWSRLCLQIGDKGRAVKAS